MTPKAKAQYKEISTCGTRIRVKTINPVDGWSDANTITGGVFYGFWKAMPFTNEKGSVILAVLTGFVEEIYVDGLQNDFIFKADPNGADFKHDTAKRAIGACMACALDLLFDMRDNRLYVTDNSIGVTLNLN